MFEIVFQLESGKEVKAFAAPGQNLLQAARKVGVPIDAPCSGNGSCGKCKVRILEGEVRAPKSRHLSDEEEEMGWRLACQSKICSNATFWVPNTASAFQSGMKSADLSSPEEVALFETVKERISSAGIAFQNRFALTSLTLTQPTLDDTLPDNERFCQALQQLTGKPVRLSTHALVKLPQAMRQREFQLQCVLEEAADSVFVYDLFGTAEPINVCGLAIDIGTTSVSALLCDLLTGEILAKVSAGNGQIQYGADVINRIIESTRPGGQKRLQDAIIRDTLNPMIRAMLRMAHLPKDAIYRLCISGNTTMNHLLLGIYADPIRMEPFIPAFFEIPPFPASNLGLPVHPDASVIVTPNVGSYVGGDITAGVLASTIWNQPDFSLFIDLGTNGELVFGNEDFLMSCACSAGPAFEGGDISCGMRATDGAIEACRIDPETMEPTYTVVGNKKPIGLCGSGIIDVISELFSAKIINAKGLFVREGSRIRRDEHGMGSYLLAGRDDTGSDWEVVITEVDINNFIHAKAAIYSAIRAMLGALDFDLSMISNIYIAGGIGSGINMKHAVSIGMLPDLPLEVYHYIGNTSLAGAYTVLLSEHAEQKVREIGRNMTYLELSTHPGYMDEFVAASFLPHTDASLFPSVT